MANMVLFDTAIGRCGLAWIDGGVVAVGLPEESEADMTAYLAAFDAVTAEPDELAAGAIEAITDLLDGLPADLSGIPLLIEVSEFDAAVYNVARSIPPGSTMTYGQVATALGHPGAAQAVGGALGRNPVPIIVPCHRVLGAGREVGGFSAPGGASTKEKILAIEGVAGFGEPTLF